MSEKIILKLCLSKYILRILILLKEDRSLSILLREDKSVSSGGFNSNILGYLGSGITP
jgi:hypothetical protein